MSMQKNEKERISRGKRYFWLKLYDNFFNQAVIKFLRRMPEGDTIVIIYLELLLLSVQTEGYICTDGLCESLEEDLALVLDEDVMKVRLALAALEKTSLLVQGTGDYEAQMTKLPEMVGFSSETAGALRMRNYRHRKAALTSAETEKASHCDTAVTQVKRLRDGDIELEKDIDIDKEREGEKKIPSRTPYGRYQNVFLSEQEAADLSREYPAVWKNYLEQLSSFMASDGRSYQNHAATIRRWIERDKQKTAAEARNYSEGEEGSL